MRAPLTVFSAFRQRAFVLPIVLVILVLMTTVVLYLLRRGVVDELLASNVRAVTTMDTAAQFTLRWCELWLWTSPPGIAAQANRPNPPRVVTAPASTAAPAWLSADWEDEGVTLPAAAVGVPDVTDARCLIEDATAEMEFTSDLSADGGNRLQLANTWRKYRVTAEVQGPGPGGLRTGRAQSEVRMNVN